jgi:hypothetical protein
VNPRVSIAFVSEWKRGELIGVCMNTLHLFTVTFHTLGIGTLIACVSLDISPSCTCQQPALFLADMSSLYTAVILLGVTFRHLGFPKAAPHTLSPLYYKSYINR